MTAGVADEVVYPGPRKGGPVEFAVDCGVMTWRNLLTIIRIPQLALGATVQPLMFVVMFSYVLGSTLGGDEYRQFLIPGIFAQTVAFNAAYTAIGLATDTKRGIIDRFKSLPTARIALVVGRTTSDLVINVVGLAIMTGVGYAIGWRIHGGVGETIGAYLLVLLFGYAISWAGAVIGLLVSTAESAQAAMMIFVFPIAFISSAFVASAKLPGPLRFIADWNPMTSVARALREAFGNPIAPNPSVIEPHTWASAHPALYTVIASIALIAVCSQLAAAAFSRR